MGLVRLLLLLWLTMLVAFSVAPTSLKWQMGTMGPFHSWGHFIAFFVMGVLLSWSAGRFSSWVLRCFVGVAIAVTLEGLEAAIYHNPFEWRDFRTDALGVVLGIGAAAGAIFVRSLLEKRRANARLP